MALVIAGGLLAVLGLAAALLLVAAPMGWTAHAPGLSLWVLFPLFSLLGYALLAVGARDPAVRVSTRLLAWPLLGVALVAAMGLVAAGGGVIQLAGSSLSLWYVLVLAGLGGTVGSAIGGAGGDRS
ncbi:hypothetical protein [Ideonella sp.]|uniref:hypothetical protein n=1 Tax=Ideonella sp. TaxID=1929293 RepID=UPI0035AD9FDE